MHADALNMLWYARRAADRVALERHIPSLLGGQERSPATVQAVMAGLEKRGIVEFSDKAIKYRIPAAQILLTSIVILAAFWLRVDAILVFPSSPSPPGIPTPWLNVRGAG